MLSKLIAILSFLYLVLFFYMIRHFPNSVTYFKRELGVGIGIPIIATILWTITWMVTQDQFVLLCLLTVINLIICIFILKIREGWLNNNDDN